MDNYDNEYPYRCEHCEAPLSEDEGHWYYGDVYCDECYNNIAVCDRGDEDEID